MHQVRRVKVALHNQSDFAIPNQHDRPSGCRRGIMGIDEAQIGDIRAGGPGRQLDSVRRPDQDGHDEARIRGVPHRA